MRFLKFIFQALQYLFRMLDVQVSIGCKYKIRVNYREWTLFARYIPRAVDPKGCIW